MLDALLALAVILGFVFLADIAGFLLTGGIYSWLLMVRFRRGAWLSSLAVATATALVVDWAFRAMLLVPLPRGDLLAFFDRPLAAAIGTVTIAIWLLVVVGALRRWRRSAAKAG